MHFSNSVRVKRDAWSGDAAEVHRGPLLFALRPDTVVNATPFAGAGNARGEPTTAATRAVTLAANSSWNYAIRLHATDSDTTDAEAVAGEDTTRSDGHAQGTGAVGEEDTTRSDSHEQGAVVWNGFGPVQSGMPFSTTSTPASVTVAARLLPSWTLAPGSLDHPQPTPASPVKSTEPLQQLKLVPYGCTNLRISIFPVLEK